MPGVRRDVVDSIEAEGTTHETSSFLLLAQLTPSQSPSQPRFVAALPLVFYPILSGLSITMFILLLTLLAIIAGSKYQVRIVAVAYTETLTLSHIRSSLVARRHHQCDQYVKVAVAIISMTVIYLVDAVLFHLLIYLGWRGAPLNESKRMPQMSILVHIWVAWGVVKAGFTGYGLYVLYSPRIESSCWSNNPCDYQGTTTLAQSCVPGAPGEIKLTDPCLLVFNNEKEFSSCFEQWGSYAAGWMRDNYRGVNQTTGDAMFNYPGEVNCSKMKAKDPDVSKLLNQEDLELYRAVFKALGEPTGDNPLDEMLQFFFFEQLLRDNAGLFQEMEAFVEGNVTSPRRLPLNDSALGGNVVGAYLGATARYASGNESAIVTDAPWLDCLPEGCPDLLQLNCNQWKVLMELPTVYRWRSLYEAIVWISVAVIGLTVLVFVLSFNAFPDYEAKESWEGLLSGMARQIEGYADYDPAWMAGVGGLLWGLFGGIDLDFTDLLLGLYLVWVRQRWKRKDLVRRWFRMLLTGGVENVVRAGGGGDERSWIGERVCIGDCVDGGVRSWIGVRAGGVSCNDSCALRGERNRPGLLLLDRSRFIRCLSLAGVSDSGEPRYVHPPTIPRLSLTFALLDRSPRPHQARKYLVEQLWRPALVSIGARLAFVLRDSVEAVVGPSEYGPPSAVRSAEGSGWWRW